MAQMLDGIKVLDFSHIHAGPLCTYQLALMGAEVIKVEPPNTGDQMRGMIVNEVFDAISPQFLGQNANKRSIVIDLKNPKAKEVIDKLIATSDVIVINMRPGTAERLGVGYQMASEVKPDIVYCAISGYGQTGPEADRPAMDHLMQGESGMFNATGTLDQPVRVGFAISDASTAIISSSAILAALVRRSQTGEGAYLDVSMLESSMAVMGLNYYSFLATGRVNERPGANPLTRMGSAGTWQTADGTLLVNANNRRAFVRMAAAVGREDLPNDPRFSTNAKCLDNGQALRQVFAGIFIQDTAEHWDQLLRDAGVPSGIMKTPVEVVTHPQLQHRRTINELEDVPGIEGPLRFLGPGFLVDEQPLAPTFPPPRLGEHTLEILNELGYDDRQSSTLMSERVVDTASKPTEDTEAIAANTNT